MRIISEINNLPITKQQFVDGTINFIHAYKRLPYLPEDDVNVNVINNEGEVDVKIYRAGKYVKGYYKTQDKMTTELISSGELTYKEISKIIGIDVKLLESVINGELKEIDNVNRICIENFFNKDYFPKQSKFAETCKDCKNSCKQKYNVAVMQCKKKEKK